MGINPPRTEELTHLYERLSVEERDELLQCLLIAAPLGGEVMIEVLEETLLCHATEELLSEHGASEEGNAHDCPGSHLL